MSSEGESSMTQERLDFVPSSVTPTGPVRSRLHGWIDNLQAHRKAWMALRGLREIILIGGVYALYDVTRYFVSGDHDAAVSHGLAIYRFEQRLHIDPEHWLNRLVSPHVLLAVPSDYIYATLHYIVTPAVLIWMWRRNPSEYGSARTVLMWTTIVGLVCFSLAPVAPPRLLPGFIDTMARYAHDGWWSTAASAPRGFGHDTNQYAAMPSLHVGWAVWSGWQMLKYGRRKITRILGVAYPFVLSFVVIATANHYLLDVVAGFATVGVGALISKLFARIDIFSRRGSSAGSAGSPPSAAPV
jgi:PAP2 superfamily protein